MHRVGRTREIEDQPVARSDDLGVEDTLLRASQAGVGPPHPLGAVELEIRLVCCQLVGQKLSRRSLYPARDRLIGRRRRCAELWVRRARLRGRRRRCRPVVICSSSLPPQAATARAIAAAGATQGMNFDIVSLIYLRLAFDSKGTGGADIARTAATECSSLPVPLADASDDGGEAPGAHFREWRRVHHPEFLWPASGSPPGVR